MAPKRIKEKKNMECIGIIVGGVSMAVLLGWVHEVSHRRLERREKELTKKAEARTKERVSGISVGSTVRLKSGGCPMTVLYIGDGVASCAWQSAAGFKENECYPLEALSLVKEAELQEG